MLKLERDQIAAQLAALNQILHSLPGDDYLGRVGFESQRDELEDRLTHLAGIVHNRARVALYFGGGPVIGSDGIQAEFGTKILGTFQDLVTKVWGSLDGIDIQPMGPIKDKDASQLHTRVSFTAPLASSLKNWKDKMNHSSRPRSARPRNRRHSTSQLLRTRTKFGSHN